MQNKGTVLYIGGFELPDKNAAAQRVIGIAKGLRDSGYTVIFVNALKEYKDEPQNKSYFGFKTIEYQREKDSDYLFGAKRVTSIISEMKPSVIIAYNYPAVALNKIRKYCKKNSTRCIADVTEWPKPVGGNLAYRIIKELDTLYRMRFVQKRLDAVIAISRYLYDYYKQYVPTALIPPTVDIKDKKWSNGTNTESEVTSFSYAGSPSALKEKLDIIVDAVEACAKDRPVVFNIIGITKEQFIKMYSWNKEISDAIVFWGRRTHEEVLKLVQESTWTIILRENNIVVKAGFPTKLVESISCGTAVIINEFSNVTDYLNETNSIVISGYGEIKDAIVKSCGIKKQVDREQFDYARYEKDLESVIG